jgi:uncharacterized membrane protein
MLGSALEIFTKYGLAGASRWLHVIAGITWIGLLYYFNFVQVPAFGEMEAAARNNAIDKIASRALWWFRWGAVGTLVMGLMIIAFQPNQSDYFKGANGVSILTGILLALTMFFNVWLVIWPAQQVVIANARNVQAGGEANPDAPAAGRKAFLASRMNTIFSIPMLLFMVGTSHFFVSDHFKLEPGGGVKAVYWIITIVIWAALELSALGYIQGTGPGPTKQIFENHKNAIITGFVLAGVWYVLWEILFRA